MHTKFFSTLLHELEDASTHPESDVHWIQVAAYDMFSSQVKNIYIENELRNLLYEIQTTGKSLEDLHGDPHVWTRNAVLDLQTYGRRAFDKLSDGLYLPLAIGTAATAALSALFVLLDIIERYDASVITWAIIPLYAGSVVTSAYIAYIAILRRFGFNPALIVFLPMILAVYLLDEAIDRDLGIFDIGIPTVAHSISIFVCGIVCFWAYRHYEENKLWDLSTSKQLTVEQWEDRFIATLYERALFSDKKTKAIVNMTLDIIEVSEETPMRMWGNPVSYARSLSHNTSRAIGRQVFFIAIANVLLIGYGVWVSLFFSSTQTPTIVIGILITVLSGLLVSRIKLMQREKTEEKRREIQEAQSHGQGVFLAKR